MDEIRPFALMIEECRELYAILTTPHINVRRRSHVVKIRTRGRKSHVVKV